MSDIIERLRQRCIDAKGEPTTGNPGSLIRDMFDAAQEIDRLRNEVERLRDAVCDELTAESQRLGLY